MVSRPSLSCSPDQSTRPLTLIPRSPRSEVRRTAPLAPRSGPPAATLSGGLRPGSLRVHDPCKQDGHGSRLGFPGRRLPRDPAASANVARDLQVLPKQDGSLGRARGAGPGPGGTWFVRDPGMGSRTGTVGRGPLDRPTGGGGRAPIRPEENFATALYFLMGWCVKSPRTDGVADDRTRWPKRRQGNITLTADRSPMTERTS